MRVPQVRLAADMIRNEHPCEAVMQHLPSTGPADGSREPD